MNLRQIFVLTLQVSIVCTVFGFGLKATLGDLLYLVRQPGLLLRSLIAIFVIMPLVAIAFARMFDLRPAVEIALVALAISPVPPVLPTKEARAGGNTPYAIGLLAVLALTSIVVVPAAADLLGRYAGRPFAVAPGAIAGIVMTTILLPLVAGIIVRAALPALANRIERPVALVAKVVLLLAALMLFAASMPAVWAAVGDGTLIVMGAFVLAGLAVGHLLGGPHPDHSVVLALSSACRHPAIALAIASANFPEEQFGGIIILYLIVGGLVGVPYVLWQRRSVAAVASTARVQ